MRVKTGWMLAALAWMALAPDLLAAQWLHVRVTTERDVSLNLNLPVQAIESFMPAINWRDRQRRKIVFHRNSFSYDELYEIWQDLRSRPSQIIERRRLRFSRDGDHYVVRKPSRWGSDKVEIRTPAPVIDALFSGQDRFDVQAAVRAMAEKASGEVFEVQVDDGQTRIEIWVDDSNS